MSGFPGSDGLKSEGFVLHAGTWGLLVCQHRASPQQSQCLSSHLGQCQLEIQLPTVHEFGLCGLNWLPHFADKEVEAGDSFVYPIPYCISSKNRGHHIYIACLLCVHLLSSLSCLIF